VHVRDIGSGVQLRRVPAPCPIAFKPHLKLYPRVRVGTDPETPRLLHLIHEGSESSHVEISAWLMTKLRRRRRLFRPPVCQRISCNLSVPHFAACNVCIKLPVNRRIVLSFTHFVYSRLPDHLVSLHCFFLLGSSIRIKGIMCRSTDATNRKSTRLSSAQSVN
jgi:hypothetical protein